MSDGLPTEEQLRRIERGVRDRIELRRRVVRGVAGTTAGALLLIGGIALLVPRVGFSAGSSAGGGSSTNGQDASRVEVRCEPGAEPVLAIDDPDRIAAACGAVAVEFQSGSGRLPAASAVPSSASTAPSASPARSVVICRADDGVLELRPAGDHPGTVCARAGLRPY